MPLNDGSKNRADAATLLKAEKSKILDCWEKLVSRDFAAPPENDQIALKERISEFFDHLVEALAASAFNANAFEVVFSDRGERALKNLVVEQVVFGYQLLRELVIDALETAGPITRETRKSVHSFVDRGVRTASARVVEIGRRNLISAHDELREALECGEMASWRIDLTNGQITTSPGMAKIFGEEIKGNLDQVIERRVHPDDQAELQRKWRKAVSDRTPYRDEHRIIKPNGSLRWVLAQGNTRYDHNQKPIAFSGINVDITDRKLADDKRADAYQELHDFFMQSPIPMVILLGPEHRFSLANEPYEKFIGMKVTGKTVAELFPPSEVARFTPLLDGVFQTGRPYLGKEIPLNIPDENGITQHHFINIAYYPFRGRKGEIKGVLANVQDVTELVLARERLAQIAENLARSEHRLKSALENGKMGSWEVKFPGYVLTGDEQFNKFHHVPTNEDLKVQRKRITHPEDQKRLEDALEKTIKTGAPLFCEYRIRGADGEWKWIAARGEGSFNEKNEIESVSGIASVIDDRKEAELALQTAKKEAEQASELKSSFLANMSHEIRTPLGAILGFSELVRDRSMDPAERDQYIDTIIRNGKSLTRIIDDILDLAKVEAGRLEVEKVRFSFYELLQDAVELLRDKAKAKKTYLLLNIDEDVPDQILSDPLRLRQILVNLIGNAVKFTSHGGVRVAVRKSQDADGTVRLAVDVKDSGIGLSEEQKARIFQPFAQADNTTTRKFGGTGLGLALSKRLAEAIGGDISIGECQENLGCTFTLFFKMELPRSQEQIPARSHRTSHGSGLILKGLRILVVDDSPENQFLVKRLLTKSGAEVDLAGDGEEAVKKAFAGTYDLVLMDIQMPQMDGYEAKKMLDERGYTKPVLALTAHAMKEERVKTKAAGFAAHLTKPLDNAELLEAVASIAAVESV